MRLGDLRRAGGIVLFVGLILAGCVTSTDVATKEATMAQSHTRTNRLAKEKSPYLLQHQHNPVDWFPWGPEAFEKAKNEDKPILLSIGYSTCHWCHVMERESFESEELAEYLNKHFIAIKVDREERPDVDKIYMTALQAMGLGGGWPLNAFLTPDLKPFFGGTYWPPEPKYGRPSFKQVLEHVVGLWTRRRGHLQEQAADIHRQLRDFTTQQGDTNFVLAPSILTNAAEAFSREYDSTNGGFGTAPKFPRPTQPAFLLRQAVRHQHAEAIKMVLHTCDAMAAGGMYDQLGGGFARYSVDAKWLVPHFEKMLYDNAQLIHLYLDAYLVSGDKKHADVARDIIRYVLRDMTHPDGGFYSAEDADSEGKEGKFYCWTKAELQTLLTPDEFAAAVEYFGITDKGNFVDHSDPDPIQNQNVLSIVRPEVAATKGPALASAKSKMFAARAKRIRPHLDDKVLASWNGMMLGAIARAAAVLNDEKYFAVAEKNIAFLKSKLWDAKSKTLYNRWREGERDEVQLLDAYANLAAGVVQLYEVTLNPAHLEFALALADKMVHLFYDSAEGGFFQSPAGADDLILRIKDDYDGAEPSGNSIATWVMLKLGHICDRKDFKAAADKTLKLFADKLHRTPQAVPQLLIDLDFLLDEPKRVAIVSSATDAEQKALILAAHQVYQPNKVVLGNAGPVEEFVKGLPKQGASQVFLCTGTECRSPTRDPIALQAMLRER